jgi:AcrR family transcriptional regulator
MFATSSEGELKIAAMQTTIVDRSLGLRERNKLEKRRRIYQVARKLFEKQGYDSTSMRQIARAADVGEGTVFLYAKDKRELLFRIFKDELATVFDEAFRQVPRDAPFVDQILAFMTPLLQFLQPHGALARIMVRENFNLTGPVEEEFSDLRSNINSKFGRLLTDARQGGQIRSDRELPPLVDAIWSSIRFYTDDWLGQRKPALHDGIGRIQAGLTLLFEGIATEAAARNSRAQSDAPRKGNTRVKSRA